MASTPTHCPFNAHVYCKGHIRIHIQLQAAFGHILKYCQSCHHPVMALTATATPAVQQDIIDCLKKPSPVNYEHQPK